MSHVLPESLLARLSECLVDGMGLHFPERRWSDLEQAIGRAATIGGFKDPESYVQGLLSRPLTQDQIKFLASHLTVGETYFFRERLGFDCLEQSILPDLIRARRNSARRLRIWSAGCCTGEEPYSIAILLARMIPDWREWNISILATDINPRFLHAATQGIYGDWSFRDTPANLKERFFEKTRDGRFEVASHIKAMVTFRYLNLAEDIYPSLEGATNAMDIIFCRNVLMYFEPTRSRRVLQGLCRSLVDAGWLFVSSAELSLAALPPLVAVNFPGAVVYKKGSGSLEMGQPLGAADIGSTVNGWDLRPFANRHADEESAPELRSPNRQEILRRPPRRTEPPAPALTPYQDAVVLYERGCYAEAAEKLLLSPESHDAEVMSLLARAYANEGRLADALAWCEKAVAADMLNPGRQYLLATILQELCQDNEAAAALKRALYLDQNYVLAHFGLGNLARHQGKSRDSEKHFRNALSILKEYAQEYVLPESEGITAGRLSEIIRSVIASEAST